MKVSSTVVSSTFAALVAADGINPLTVTSWSPAQASELSSAASEYYASLETEPAFVSAVAGLVSETSLFDVLQGFQTVLPTGSAAVVYAESLFSQLPSADRMFFNSILSDEISMESSVLNKGAMATGASATGAAASTSGSQATGSVATAASSTASGNGAQSTGASYSLAGIAVGIFGAVVAMM